MLFKVARIVAAAFVILTALAAVLDWTGTSVSLALWVPMIVILLAAAITMLVTSPKNRVHS